MNLQTDLLLGGGDRNCNNYILSTVTSIVPIKYYLEVRILTPF